MISAAVAVLRRPLSPASPARGELAGSRLIAEICSSSSRSSADASTCPRHHRRPARPAPSTQNGQPPAGTHTARATHPASAPAPLLPACRGAARPSETRQEPARLREAADQRSTPGPQLVSARPRTHHRSLWIHNTRRQCQDRQPAVNELPGAPPRDRGHLHGQVRQHPGTDPPRRLRRHPVRPHSRQPDTAQATAIAIQFQPPRAPLMPQHPQPLPRKPMKRQSHRHERLRTFTRPERPGSN